MCQLFALNAAEPTDITFSFTGFAARGGLTDDHVDGWGIAFYEGKGCRLFADDRPAYTSPIAAFVKAHPVKSRNVVAHIRKATQGRPSVENCHPFMRELSGSQWVFAHNGDLNAFEPLTSGPFSPVGTTDSEAVFCSMMNTLAARFHGAAIQFDAVFDALIAIVEGLNPRGTFNFLLSNGEVQFAYCSTRLAYVARTWPFTSARLVDADLSIDFAERGKPEDCTTVIATTPLTDEEWIICRPGDLLMFSRGTLQRQAFIPVPEHISASASETAHEASRSTTDCALAALP
jgi:glutamine amidotransferase